VQPKATQLDADPARPGAAVEAVGLEVEQVSATRVVAHMQLGPSVTPMGIIHGDVYATAVESK
jgi:acyl-coenzyme A thioesterase PaaI-like protein